MTRQFEAAYPDLARELRQWLLDHPEQGTDIRSFADKNGFVFNTTRKWFSGGAFPSGDAYARLRVLTGLPSLQTPPARANPGQAKPRISVSPMEGTAPTSLSSPAERSQQAGPDRIMDATPATAEEAKRRHLLVALRTWLGQHPETSHEQLAALVGVSDRSLRRFLAGHRYPDATQRASFARVTGIKFESNGVDAAPSQVAPPVQVAQGLREEAPRPTPPPGQIAAEVRDAAAAMVAFARTLRPIIRGPPALRRGLRQTIDLEDASYISAALKALYSNEEDFQTWKHFAHPQEG